MGKETSADAPEIITILGKGSAFDGKLTFEGTVRIDGTFSGEIRTDGTLIVGEPAHVTAQIEAATVVIEGSVRGDIRAHDLVELRATARVVGTLRCESLQVERGAVFDGTSAMLEADAASPEPEPAPS